MGVSINSFGSGRRAPNDDGIDLSDTRYVHISDCDIQNGDDCIVVLGGEDITVANCTLSSRSSAVRVDGFAGRTFGTASSPIWRFLTAIAAWR